MRFSVPSLWEIDPESFTLAEAELRQALEEHLRQGGQGLDLRAHGEALRSAPDEWMECFADACRRIQRRVRVLQLPAGLDPLPSWVGAFPEARCLGVPGQDGTRAPMARAA